LGCVPGRDSDGERRGPILWGRFGAAIQQAHRRDRRHPNGGGYWLVASDGGIFTFDDAAFHGSTGNLKLNQPIVGMAATPTGGGYWLVASDGGIFTFSDVSFYGSDPGIGVTTPAAGIVADGEGEGYTIILANGGFQNFTPPSPTVISAPPVTPPPPSSAPVSAATWTLQDTPAPPMSAALVGVDCMSATFCMAVGSDPTGNDPAFAEQWNGLAWMLLAVPSPTVRRI
jgi:hypothetical protein